jgi:OOP family OmpA-OmpF porin
MKLNPFSLLLLTVICIFTGVTYAQENNYIVSKYDFIPGEKVIFFDDFASESIGDFPAQWLTNGSGEIVTLEKFPARWFHITKMGYFIPEAKEDFTDNFTIEFDFVPMTTDNGENMYSFTFYLLTGSLAEPGGGGEPADAGFQVYLDGEILGWKNWSLQNEQRFNGTVTYPFKSNVNYHIAIWVQKQRVRLYANETKVLDVPRAIPAGSKPNIFRFDSRDEAIPLISNFRIAAGLPDMRNRLLKDGKIISYGIQFDVNSDKLKPESYSTLKEISDIMKENPAVRIQIVGHTDSDGDEASNLDLSKRRGVSVKNELVNKFGVDAARLETDGKGESEPLADNNSAVNKAKNRRVEFISLKGEPKPAAAAKNSAVQGSGTSMSQGSGKTYKSVKIGSQTWMAENLNVSRFRNGDPIPEAKTIEEWVKASPSWCYYDNDPKNEAKYGRLYNWFAMTDPRGLAPEGWHVPNGAEWETLNKMLGGIGAAGAKMKSASGWDNNGNGTNECGFSGLPGGYRHNEGTFLNTGSMGFWWSTSETDSSGNLAHTLNSTNSYFGWGEGKAMDYYGFSVRCVKD